MINRFKPRYKKCYQVKNKIWINKNSKLRGFFIFRKFRNTRLKKKKLKSMKWNIARRFLLPRLQKRQYPKYRYKFLFQNKQKIKYFYGKIKEYQLQQLYNKNCVNQKSFKQTMLIGSLEKRLDVILHRSKFVPTIFMAHQIINHQGLYINDNLVNNMGYNLKQGDIISLDSKIWPIIYKRLNHKLKMRSYGHLINDNQRKKKYYRLQRFNKSKQPSRFKFKLVYEYYKTRAYALRYNKRLKNFKNSSLYSKNELILLNKVFDIKINKKIQKIDKEILPLVRQWHGSNYLKSELKLILMILTLQRTLNKIIYISKLKLISNYFKDKNSNIIKLLFIKNFYQYNKYKEQLKETAQDLIFNSSFLRLLKKRKLERIYTSKNQKELQNPRWHKNPLWYIPNYLEIDYKTLRISFLYNPNNNEVLYPFYCSYDDLITFYKNQGK